MLKHWQYLKYVLRHKWHVFAWCWHYGIPLAGIVHDWSKFLPDEWGPYADYFYGGEYPERNYGDIRNVGGFDRHGEKYTKAWAQARFDEAWLKHQHRNPHHWQYWVLQRDEGESVCLPMPHRYAREMLADWRGAGMAITGKDNVQEWYKANRHKMQLHPGVRRWVEDMLGVSDE